MPVSPVNKYHFASAKPCNIPWLCDMEVRSHKEPWSEQAFFDEIRDAKINNSRFWLIKSSDTPLGYIVFRLILDELYILKITVHPAMRRKGLGKRLIEQTLAFARRKRLRQITLDVRYDNPNAIAFYKSIGFLSTDFAAKKYTSTVMWLPVYVTY